jgi:hypothetical protein
MSYTPTNYDILTAVWCLTFQRTNSAILTSSYVLTEILFALTALSYFIFIISVRNVYRYY